MKLGTVAKLDKRKTVTSKKFDHDFMSENCDVIVFFPIYGQSTAIRKLNFERMVFLLNLLFN